MERAYGYARVLASGAPAPAATVTVYNLGTLVLATIFSDNLGTPKANPFVADANAYFYFYAANGRYDLQFSGAGAGIPVPYTWGDELLSDFISLGGLTAPAQLFAVGTAGNDFNIASAVATHTFNLPSASATARGVVTTLAQIFAGAKTFTTPIAHGSGGTGLSALPTNGQLLIGNGAGYTLGSIGGTANQITVTGGAGTITLSGPQDLAAASSPAFTGLTVSGLTDKALIYGAAGVLTSLPLIDGQLLIGRTGLVPLAATLTAGSGISIVNGVGSITIASSGAITSLNGSTVPAPIFGTSSAGVDFTITTDAGTGVTTFAIPDSTATNRGFVATTAQSWAGVKTFTSPPIGIGEFIRKTGNQVVNASVAQVAVTDLSFPIAANEVLTFEFVLQVGGIGTADIAFGITGPAAPTSVWYGLAGSGSVLVAAAVSAFAGTISMSTNGAAAHDCVIIKGAVRNGANAGTIQLTFAQASAIAADTTVYAESFCIVSRRA